MLNRQSHEIAMKRILINIYSNPKLSSKLCFKGGTLLFFAYDLNRFSTDLDFNLISEIDDLQELEKCFIGFEIKEKYQKLNTIFYLLSYGEKTMNIKIEISKRDYPDETEIISIFGIKMLVLKKNCITAHKLCAILDRRVIANRDLFDAYFLFVNNWEIKEEIIKLRTGLTAKEYFKKLILALENYPNKNINNGLGEVLTESQKDWTKQKLLSSLINELKIRV
jgi:predicted nucleotidyltransferase component of viral defense system